MQRNTQQDKKSIGRPSAALVIAIVALICALTGTAWAALGKNSVGSRQLKAKAVTTGKIANGAINGAKVANGSLSGADINVGALGTVPKAASADSAGNAATLGGHSAACPAATILIRGICFDSHANAAVQNQAEAADGCAAKGGWLPAPMDLYTVRGVLNLGTGTGSEEQFTNEVYANTNGVNYRTVTVDGNGRIAEHQTENDPAQYTCAYALVR
jgi:hypothetical protein